MYRNLSWIILLVVGWSAAPASAADHWHRLFNLDYQRVDCIGSWCCDDYCPKKEPCTKVCLSRCCDDYCPKKQPCTHVCLGRCCDDYGKKCPPKVCTSPACGTSGCGSTCSSGGCDRACCDAGCDNCSMSDLLTNDNPADTNTSIEPKDWMEIVADDPGEFPAVRISNVATTLTR